MKKFLLVLVAAFCIAGLSAGARDAEAASASYLGSAGGGGPLLTQMYFDLDAINKQVQEYGDGPTLSGSFFAFGGGGFAANYNVRFGGGGGNGDLASGVGTDGTSLSVGFGYFDLGFTSPVNNSLTIITGGRFGGGRATLTVGNEEGSVSFGSMTPYVELEKKVSPSIAFVGNVGYFFPFQVGNGSGPEGLRPKPDHLSGWSLGLALRFGAF